jgi:hypothetical protein
MCISKTNLETDVLVLIELLWYTTDSMLNGILVLPLGSLTSCDSFLNVFQGKGLKPEAVCPCASSTEALTVSIRRSATNKCHK